MDSLWKPENPLLHYDYHYFSSGSSIECSLLSQYRMFWWCWEWGRGNAKASLWSSVVNSYAGWCEQIELGIPFTEFWSVRGQVAVLNHQRQVRCNYYNGQQDQSSSGGALTLRDLWDDWEIMLFQAQLVGCYVTCITRKKVCWQAEGWCHPPKWKVTVFDPSSRHKSLSRSNIHWLKRMLGPLEEGHSDSTIRI